MSEITKQAPEMTQERPEILDLPASTENVIAKARDEDSAPDSAPDRLDVYELEKGHKLSEEYFNVREIMVEDFGVKMNVYAVDKYVKQLMKDEGLQPTVANFTKTLEAIEEETGSKNLDVIARLQKLASYAKLMHKLRTRNEDKKKYLSV